MRLYINACVHVGEGSRTKELADYYLSYQKGIAKQLIYQMAD